MATAHLVAPRTQRRIIATKPRSNPTAFRSLTGNTRFAVSLHILTLLAFRAPTVVCSTEIAQSVRSHPVVVRRLIAALVAAGLVESRKGRDGGFTLDKEPEKISLRDIFVITEPRMKRAARDDVHVAGTTLAARIDLGIDHCVSRALTALESAFGSMDVARLVSTLRVHSVPAKTQT
jgi:Rrf2 family protein